MKKKIMKKSKKKKRKIRMLIKNLQKTVQYPLIKKKRNLNLSKKIPDFKLQLLIL